MKKMFRKHILYNAIIIYFPFVIRIINSDIASMQIY